MIASAGVKPSSRSTAKPKPKPKRQTRVAPRTTPAVAAPSPSAEAPANVAVDAIRRTIAGEPPSARHIEVLYAALQLISERGYAGASLRELARRLGVSQPSLYHYFTSKEDLVDQIISHLGQSMFQSLAPPELPAHADGIPTFLVKFLVQLYRDETYPRFVRFVFLTALEQPRHRAAVRRLYTEQGETTMRLVLAPYAARGEIELEEGVRLLQLIVRGVGLAFIEERVLYQNDRAEEFLQGLIEYAERAGQTLVRAARPAAKKSR